MTAYVTPAELATLPKSARSEWLTREIARKKPRFKLTLSGDVRAMPRIGRSEFRAMLKELALSGADFARFHGINPSALDHALRGRTKGRAGMSRRAAVALGAEVQA